MPNKKRSLPESDKDGDKDGENIDPMDIDHNEGDGGDQSRAKKQ